MDVIAILAVHSLNTILLLFGLIYSVQRRRFYAALIAGLLLYHLLSIFSITFYIEVFGIEVVTKGEIIALVGICALFLTISFLEYSLQFRRTYEAHSYLQQVVESPHRYLIIAIGSFVIIALITMNRGSILLESNWEAERSNLGFFDSVATLLQFLAFPVVWLLYRIGQRAWAIVFLALSIAVFSVYGSRAALLTIPAVIALDFYSRGLLSQKKYAVLGGLLVLMTVLSVHVGGRILRALGFSGLINVVQGDFSPIVALLDDTGQIDWTGGESGITFYYLFVIKEGTIHGVEALATAFRWITIYLPRSIAPDLKPIDPTYALWLHAANAGLFDSEDIISRILDLVRSGDTGSIHPLFWGEAWMNGGVPALLTMSVLLGLIVFGIDCLYRVMPATVVALIGPATAVGYLMIARGNSVIGLGFIAYLLPPALLGYIGLTALKSLIPTSSAQSRTGMAKES